MNADELLRDVDLDELLAAYDQAARRLLEVARQDGHFSGRDAGDLIWPGSDAIDADGLARRVELITTIYQGIPPRRDSRLAEAHERYAGAMPEYARANRTYLQVRRQFVERQAGTERDFLQLYQAVYLEALSRENPFPLDAGEAALVELRVARAPLSHAQSVAGKLQTDPRADDPRWDEEYAASDNQRLPLRAILRDVAERVVDLMAAGEHLAIRYNTFSNFIWFGISIWKVVSELELLVSRLRGRARQAWLDRLLKFVRLAQGMLLKFLEAHSEDPAQIRPKDYWYGQEYSYLTRDMIDLTVTLVDRANALIDHARGRASWRRGARRALADLEKLEIPPLLRNQVSGRFLEYPHVGPRQALSSWQRRRRVLAWVSIFRQTGRRKKQLHRSGLSEEERLSAAWQNNTQWGNRTLDLFGIEVRIVIDPLFAPIAAELELHKRGRKIVFFPTHQSLLDHPVMYRVLQSRELIEAMGWDGPVPCTQLARARLMAPTSIKIGSRELSLIGVDPDLADRQLEEVDGYVVMDRSRDASSPTARFAKLLEKRPGVVYGAGTTSAFELQCLPMQHALFAHLPPDAIFIPMAFRGVHALWPKCPRGNLNVSPGLVEVVVSPPMLGETTLLPRKRALRTQLEPATLFQAVHIAALLNPEPVEGCPDPGEDPGSAASR